MFLTEQQFLDSFLAFPGWETDSSIVQPIMTIVVDGTQHVIEGSMDTVPNMQALINTINDSPVGIAVIASVAQDPQTQDFYLALNAASPDVTSIVVLNDQSLLFNRVQPPANDGTINGTFITGITAVEVNESIPVTGDQIEPKNDGSVLDRVYLPLHTRVSSNEPVVDVNYWASYTHNTGTMAMNPSSIVSSHHPITGEPVVYVLYVDNVGGYLVIECRYANGIKCGQLVTGINNRMAFAPLPSSYVDSYYSTVSILSSTLVYAGNTGMLYVKSIVCGQLYDTGYSSESTSCVVITKLDRTLDMGQLWWSRLVFHDPLYYSPTGYGAYQRSDGGMVIDNENNIIVANNINAFNEPLGDGTPPHVPAFELLKINGQTGNIEWSRVVFSNTFTSNVDGPVNTLEMIDPSVSNHYPVPACVDINAVGDIFVGHASILHKFSPTGNNIWSKYFPTAKYNTRLTEGYTFAYISGVQAHQTTGDLYVAVSGALSEQDSGGPPYACATVYKMADSNNIDVVDLTQAFRFTPLGYNRVSDTWNNQILMCDAIVIKLDSSTNSLYAATRLRYHGVPETTNFAFAAGLTVAKLNATNMQLQWSYDTAFTEFFGTPGDSNEDRRGGYQLDGPTSYLDYWELRKDGGYTNFDFVYDDNDNVTSICYCVPMGFPVGDGGGPVTPNRGGWVVTQSTSVLPLSAGGTGDVKYEHVEMTTVDAAYNETINERASLNWHQAINGMADLVPDSHYNTFTHIANSPAVNYITNPELTRQYLFLLPPMSATVAPSLYVDNIARVGELQLGGTFAPPASLVGSVTDKKGMFRVSADGMFYCTADYDGATEIWKSAPFGSGSTFRTIPPGFNPGMGIITGGPADKIGELFASEDGTILMCTAAYTGQDQTWFPLSIPQGNGIMVTTYTDYTYDDSNDNYWPDGAYLSQYYIQLSLSGGNSPADIVGGCFGKPAANAAITNFVAPRSMWFSDQNANAGLWRCRTAPSGNVILNIQVNGSTVGAVRFTSGNTYGTMWTSWGQRNLFTGDVLSVIAPSSQDSTFADVYFSILGGLQ